MLQFYQWTTFNMGAFQVGPCSCDIYNINISLHIKKNTGKYLYLCKPNEWNLITVSWHDNHDIWLNDAIKQNVEAKNQGIN